MSDENKCFSRPKVRFSQSTECPEKLGSSRAFEGPKIRSIVNFKPSITILKAPSEKNYFERSSSPEETSSRHSREDVPNRQHHCPQKTASGSAPSLNDIVLTPENRIPKLKNQPDKKESLKTVSKNLVSKQFVKENSIGKKDPATKENLPLQKDTKNSFADNPKKVIKQTIKGQDINSIGLQSKSTESHSNKENVPVAQVTKKTNSKVPDNVPKTRKDIPIKSTSSQSNDTQSKKAPIKFTKPGLTKKLDAVPKSSTLLSKNTKPKAIGAMPHTKPLVKGVPIKKSIVRDTNRHPLKVHVGPGVPRPRSLESVTRASNSVPRSQSEILLADKFARPEYNSIISTIEKWNKARKEKVVKDLEHLPSAYRQLINGKISSALDFAANEVIYHDLVDLSIDDKRLPSRVPTRSKDPEPRQRDLVPKLSDFFIPTNNEDYRQAVCVRPPSPRILDISNPYKISDRIFSWKESLDHDL